MIDEQCFSLLPRIRVSSFDLVSGIWLHEWPQSRKWPFRLSFLKQFWHNSRTRRAVERIEADESCRSIARDLPNLTRQTLMNIYKNPDRRRWYLETEAADERVDAALETVR
jgi:hypothetical protein